MVSWPARLKPRLDREHLASNVDLWPTLAALLQTPTPKGLPGINLTDAKAVSRRARIHGASFSHNIADVDAPTRSLQTRWVIDGWWKLIVPNPRNRPDAAPELYDLRNDPWETKDCAADAPRRVAALGKRLDAWWKP
jgi:uncharacterized sulfatase